MVRWLNVIAVLALLGSAVYAYRTKYETIFYAEQITKLKNQNQRERDSIAVLQAEWAHLTRPTRIQSLSDQHLDLKQLTVDQIVQVTDLPDQPPKQDTIARKLELLGLGDGASTPRDPRSEAERLEQRRAANEAIAAIQAAIERLNQTPPPRDDAAAMARRVAWREQLEVWAAGPKGVLKGLAAPVAVATRSGVRAVLAR